MGLFDRFQENGKVLAWARGQVSKMSQVVADSIRSIFQVKWSYSARKDAVAYLELFHTSPRLNAVDIIATDCANTVFKVFKKFDLRTGRDDAEAISDHPIYNLLENPIPDRPDIDGFTIRYLTHVWWELQGDCYWIIVKDLAGQPRELYPIPSNWVISAPTISMPYFLVMPQGNTASQTLLVDPSDVIWFKNPNVVQPYARGRGRAEAIGDEVESDEYAAKYAKNLFYNDATPKSILTAPGATDANIQQLKESWNQQYQGVSNANKTGFLGWDAKLLQLSTNPKELDFKETRAMFRDMVNQNFQMPPEMMGIIENSNRSTIDSAFYLYSKNVLTKRLLRFDAAINRQLMPMFDPQFAIKSENVVPEDRSFHLQESQELFSAGIITRGEARVRAGFAKLDTPADDEILVALSMVPTKIGPGTGEVPILDPDEQQAGDTDVPASHEQEPLTALDDPVLPKPTDADSQPPAPPIPGKSFKMAEDKKKAFWQTFDKTATANEYPFKSGMKKIADTQQRAFNKQFTDAIGKGATAAEAIKIAGQAVFNDEANNQLYRALYQGWLSAGQAGAEMANKSFGLDVSFDKVQPLIKDWVSKVGLEKCVTINKTSFDALSKSLAAGIDSNESIRDLQSRIVDQFDGVRDFRSERIARTETAASANFGSLVVYKQAGVDQKQWLSTMDDRTRDDHTDANEQTVGIDEDFEVGGDTMQAPGLGSDAGENINCRCVALPIFAADSQEGDNSDEQN